MGGVGSTGSAEDGVDTAVNATSKNCLPSLSPRASQCPLKYLEHPSILMLHAHPQPLHRPAPPVMLKPGSILWS